MKRSMAPMSWLFQICTIELVKTAMDMVVCSSFVS
jgi:hypothetical protein